MTVSEFALRFDFNVKAVVMQGFSDVLGKYHTVSVWQGSVGEMIDEADRSLLSNEVEIVTVSVYGEIVITI